MINFYFDRIIDGVHIPNGISENFVKYYTPFFNCVKFRQEQGVEPPVYPSDLRQENLCSLKSIDTLDKNEKDFSGYYLIEGFGSAQNAMGVNPETKDKYKVVFNYIKQDTLKFLQNGTLTLCVCYIQESFVTDNIIHSIHYNTKKLNIQNSIVIVNDFLVEERYKTWCEENNEETRFKTIVFCH